MPVLASRAAVFLDRDGTMVHDVGYATSRHQLRLLPGVLTALSSLQEAGFALMVVSNQSGVGRGLMSLADAREQMDYLCELVAAGGVELDDIVFCPHSPDAACTCRKPRPGLLVELCARHGIQPASSFMVGDRESDVLAGVAAGCRAVLLGQDQAVDSAADIVLPDLAAAAEFILANPKSTIK